MFAYSAVKILGRGRGGEGRWYWRVVSSAANKLGDVARGPLVATLPVTLLS
jgi:hypothetical protein